MEQKLERPASLTPERALSLVPRLETNPEWQAKKDRGELPEGLAGFFGSMIEVWPEDQLTEDEARYVLAVREHESWRGLAEELTGDSNQYFGESLERAAKMVLSESKGTE